MEGNKRMQTRLVLLAENRSTVQLLRVRRLLPRRRNNFLFGFLSTVACG
jgi:hypothetical protein